MQLTRPEFKPLLSFQCSLYVYDNALFTAFISAVTAIFTAFIYVTALFTRSFIKFNDPGK